jgi:hypothetical protein
MGKYNRLILYFLIFFLFAAGNLSAATFRIDNPKIKLKVAPGQTVSGVIGVENFSDQELRVRAYVEDFVYLAPFNGTKDFLSPGSVNSSCSGWISFSPQEFSIPASSKIQVFYSVNVPMQASGGYYSVLFFESTLGPGKDAQGRDVTIIGRIGSLFFVETQDSLKRAEISGINASAGIISGTIANAGNTILIAKPLFYIMDEAGLVVDRGKPEELFLNPGDKTNFSVNVSESLASGRYIAVLTFDLEDQDVEIREVVFSKDSYGSLRVLEVKE